MASLGSTFYADCEIIVKTFEKGAIFSTDPKSVYAMTTPVLSRIRSDASNTDNQLKKQFAFKEKIEGVKDIQNRGMNKPSSGEAQRESDFSVSTLGLSQTNALAQEAQDNQGEIPATPSEDRDKKSDFDKNLESVWPKDRKKHFMVDCIPCEASIRSTADFHEKLFGDGDDNLLNQYTDILKQHLEGALQKIKQILKMFAKQGAGNVQDICRFRNLFSYRCPSDFLVMIKALSTLLTKISFDLLGDVTTFAGLIASLLPPFLSSLVQLLKNYALMILKPVKCILRFLAKESRGITESLKETLNLTQGVMEGGFGIGGTTRIASGIESPERSENALEHDPYESGFDPNPESKYLGLPSLDRQKLRSRTNPFTGEKMDFSFSFELGGTTVSAHTPTSLPLVRKTPANADLRTDRKIDSYTLNFPKSEKKITYQNFLALDRKKEALEALAAKKGMSQSELEVNEEYSNLKNEWDGNWVGKGIKKGETLIKAVEEFSGDLTSMVNEIAGFLMEFSLWFENFLRQWVKEFGKLIGDCLTLDIGFLNKQGKKLTLLQLISLMKAMMKQKVDKNWKCEDEDDLGELINETFAGSEDEDGNKTVVKDEDGNVSVTSDKEAATKKDKEKLWEGLDLQPTEDPNFDATTEGLKQLFTSPTEMVFSCNKNVSSAANAAQIEKWIREL